MKIKFLSACLLSACLLSPALRAADPAVVVISAMRVTIDNHAAGTVVDALADNPNVPNLRARLLDAWLAHETAIAAAEQARADAAIKTAQDSATKAKADADAAEKQLAAVVAALKSVSLGVPLPPVVAAALRTDAEKENAARTAKRAELEAQLAKLAP